MEEFLRYSIKFPYFFAAILIGYYLIPAGATYLLFFVINKERWNALRIQKRSPKLKSIYREIRWSVLSVFIFSVLTMVLFYSVKIGWTKIYFDISELGWPYFIISPLICIVIHDTYFYWTHRFMHLRWVFPYVHQVHHLSSTPTPWAILSFGPLECLILYGVYFFLAMTIPLHPIAALIFIIYNIILNTGGHTGYEIIPKYFFSHWLLRYGLTVTHHDMHHSKGNCNYGLYFIFWDTLLETNHKAYKNTYLRVKELPKKTDS